MPGISSGWTESNSLVVSVGIVPGGTFNPNKPVELSNAIIDTGATATCISSRLAREMGLIPVSRGSMSTANGIVTVNVYYVDIVMPFGGIAYAEPKKSVSEFICEDDTIKVLIGMDVIGKGQLSVSFNGTFTFSM